MATDIEEVRKDIDELKKGQDNLAKQHGEILRRMDEYFKKTDEKIGDRAVDSKSHDRAKDRARDSYEGESGSLTERDDHMVRLLEEISKKLDVKKPFEGDKDRDHDKANDRKARDESEEKRHEDEVRGGRKANAELEGEHREEKKMRADDRRAKDGKSCDEDEEERHRDEVRGGEVAEGEWKEKHDDGEKFDDDGKIRDRKTKDAEVDEEAEEADEDDATLLTIEEAEEADPTNINITLDRAFQFHAQDSAYVGHVLAPYMGMSFSYPKTASKATEKRKVLTQWRRMLLDCAQRNKDYSGIVNAKAKGRSIAQLTDRGVANLYAQVSRKARRANSVKFAKVRSFDHAVDMSPAISTGFDEATSLAYFNGSVKLGG